MLPDSRSETFPIVVREFVPGGIDSPRGHSQVRNFCFSGQLVAVLVHDR